MNGDPFDASAQLAQPQQKFLRYRSVRKPPAREPEPQSSPPPPLPQAQQSSLTRLPSRYHRRPPAQSAPPPNIPQIPSAQGHATESRVRGQTFDGVVDENGQTRRKEGGGRRLVIQHQTKGPSTSSRSGTGLNTSETTSRKPTLTSSEEPREPEVLRRSYEAAREEARLILEGEHDRLRTLRQQEAKRRQEEPERRRKQAEKLAEEVRRREAEKAAKQEAKLKARQKDDRDFAAQSTLDWQPDSKMSKMRTLVTGGSSTSKQKQHGHHRRASSAVEQLRQQPKESHARTNSANRIDEIPDAEAPTTKPKFDAPVSAVNAGERRVSVKYKEALITLPVTPSTTAQEILNSASLCMSEPIDAKTAVLLESFSQIGLERPLRRYERIRDVMNSWDNDSQNHLFIMAGDDCAAPGLQITDAPGHQPSGISAQIYHSQRPGKWDKRWLKLREDGQIITSKNEIGVGSTNICHVSDFDLYTPTAKQVKKLKPPKKLCYALKSQQKSAMFLDGTNFVHFFCTKDKEVAYGWYDAVRSWRSWYLVNVLGEGQRTAIEPALGPQLGTRPGTRGSKESLPYVLGSFKPLLGFSTTYGPGRQLRSDDQRPLIDFVSGRQSVDEKPASPEAPVKLQGPPPTAFPRKLMIESATNGNVDDLDGPFTGTGLLARSASRRTQGGQRSGRSLQGVDGKPLVDLVPTSEFTGGSLLQRMEAIAAQQGALDPKIDRQKRKEVNVAVGEGFD